MEYRILHEDPQMAWGKEKVTACKATGDPVSDGLRISESLPPER